jgi:hypothetical protein
MSAYRASGLVRWPGADGRDGKNFSRFRCTAAINAVAWTLSNYRNNDFQSQRQGLLQKRVWFCAECVGTTDYAQTIKTT